MVKNPSDLFEAALKAGDAFAEGAGTRFDAAAVARSPYPYRFVPRLQLPGRRLARARVQALTQGVGVFLPAQAVQRVQHDPVRADFEEVAQLRDQLELVSRQQPSAKPGAPSGTNPPGTAAGDPQEQAAYDGAMDLFRKGQYKEAAESLAAFTALYPNSQLAPSAQFYLGSSRYGMKDFKGAIEQLTAMVQKSPDNARAPDALLIIAGGQIELNNRAGAKATLQRIVRDYPNAQAASTAKSRLQLLQ